MLLPGAAVFSVKQDWEACMAQQPLPDVKFSESVRRGARDAVQGQYRHVINGAAVAQAIARVRRHQSGVSNCPWGGETANYKLLRV